MKDKSKTIKYQEHAKEILDVVSKGQYSINDKVYDISSYVNSQSHFIDRTDILDTEYIRSEKPTAIQVQQATTIKGVLSNPDKTWCLLNFASYVKVGGGFIDGHTAQEESLCHCTNLFQQLSQFKDVYKSHTLDCTLHCNHSLYTNDSIYSDNIAVFQNDNFEFIEPVKCSIITMSAPNARPIEYFCKEDIKKINPTLRSRCDRVLEIALHYGEKNLVLGAFGCGVFGNDITVLVQIWKDLLETKYKDVFDTILFAVPDNSSYTLFKEAFDE